MVGIKRFLPLFCIFFLLSIYPANISLAQERSLTIVFSGDSRGEIENCHCPKEDFGGLERRAVYIDNLRKEREEILLLEVGDVLPLQGPDFGQNSTNSIAEVSFKAMEIMGYDVMNIGESDLILGEDFIKERDSNLKFSLISSNIVERTTQESFLKPYIIKSMKNGLRVGILGVLNERYVIHANLALEQNKEAIIKYLPEVKKDSDVVIVLGHLGLPYSLELANSIEGIDIILSGHWDSDSQEPVKIKDTIIMPTTYKSRRIGRLDLEIDENSKVASYAWQSTALDERYEGNAEIEKLVKTLSVAAPLVGATDLATSVAATLVVASDEAGTSPAATSGPGPLVGATNLPLKVFVFQRQDCKECIKISHTILPDIKTKYKDRIEIEYFDVSNPGSYEQMLKFERIYNVQGGIVPEVFFAGYALIGAKQIRLNLDKMLEKALKSNKVNTGFLPELYQSPDSLTVERFKKFSFYTVILAGILDGINPCAFTTLVFFLSFLAYIGYHKREIICAGSAFAFAVFITYFFIGLGILKILKSLTIFSYLTTLLNVIIGLFTISLGILSICDYYRFKKTNNPNSMILKLPQSIKARIHSVVGSEFRDKDRLSGSFLKLLFLGLSAGFLISILESVCTGQVYLPTIAFVAKMPQLRSLGLIYLFVYNLAFILPLLVVFGFALFGATSQQFSGFAERHIAGVKLSTAMFFFLLGAVLLFVK